MDGGAAIMEETTPIRKERFHHTVQNNVIIICSESSLQEDHNYASKMPPKTEQSHCLKLSWILP